MGILSAGVVRHPTRYVVGWRDLSTVKVGYTLNGRRRYGAFLARGAEIIDIATFDDDPMACLRSESRLDAWCSVNYPRAFGRKADAESILGTGGAGWMECYSIPASDWPRIPLEVRI